MKLATYRDGSRDGQLVVVARDLSTAHYASQIASRLQHLLDDWNFIAPQLQDLYESLNAGRARHAFPFDPQRCMAPLPRTSHWALGDAWTQDDPGLQHAAGDGLAGACDPIACASEQLQMDCGAGLAVVTADLPQRASPEQALEGVRLLLLVNAIRLHAPGLSAVQRQPATVFGPVAVTPDELGTAWDGGRAHLTLQTQWNGRRANQVDAGADMHWHFGDLVAHLCGTRALAAGSLVGAVRGKQAGSAFARVGDSLRIDAIAADGQSLFGAIEQEVLALPESGAVLRPRGRSQSAAPTDEDGQG